jgi:DNA topoisomerase-1
MVEKNDKKRGAHKACINPDCDYLHSGDDELQPTKDGEDGE